MQACIAKGDVIVNAILLPDDWEAGKEGMWQPAAGETVVFDEGVQIGWTKIDGVWTAPPPPPEPEPMPAET